MDTPSPDARPRATRRAVVAAVALVFALGLTGCGGGPISPSAAATVGDSEIARSTVLDVVAAQQTLATKEAEAAPEGTPAAPDPVAGEGFDTVKTATASAATEFLIQLELLRILADDAGLELTDEQTELARSSVVTNLTQSGVAEEDLPEVLIDLQTEFTALQQALPTAYAPTDEELRAAYAEQAPSLVQVCVSVIITTSEADTTDALARVDAGEDFRDVSEDVTTDPALAEARGGEDCYPAADLAASFGEGLAEAEEGDIFGPVELQGQWAALQVNELRSPTLDEVRDDLTTSLSQEASQDAIAKVLEKTTVTVDPRFGTWNSETASVDEPVVAGTTTTTIPELANPGS